MDTLHRHNYDLSSALSVLVPAGGPVLCRDEMEEWSASEAAMFEEALEKYGKDFNDIRQDFVSVLITALTLCFVLFHNPYFFTRCISVLYFVLLSTTILPCKLTRSNASYRLAQLALHVALYLFPWTPKLLE